MIKFVNFADLCAQIGKEKVFLCANEARKARTQMRRIHYSTLTFGISRVREKACLTKVDTPKRDQVESCPRYARGKLSPERYRWGVLGHPGAK
jgi:hypothetical protein